MNKEYAYINGLAVVTDEKGISKTIQPSSNIDRILIAENEISLLNTYLQKDTKTLEEKKNERTSRMNFFKKSFPIFNITALAATGICTSIFMIGVDNSAQIDSIFGQISPLKNMLFANGTISIIFANIIASMELIFRPSLSEIAAYEEMIRYEKSAIEEKEQKLANIQDNKRSIAFNSADVNNKPILKVASHAVDDKNALKTIKELRDLRYSFGKYKSQFLTYTSNSLFQELNSRNYTPETITEFISYVESERQKAELTDNVSNSKKYNKRKVYK